VTSASSVQAVRYVIEVEGVVDPRWMEWFDDQDVQIMPTVYERHTTLIAQVADQAALPAMLARITGLNLKILSVRPAGRPGGAQEA
jgi:hypothetical protein